jgi:hypothetical protein
MYNIGVIMKSKLRILFINLIFFGTFAGVIALGMSNSSVKDDENPFKKEQIGTEIKWEKFPKDPPKPIERSSDDQWMLISTIILAS